MENQQNNTNPIEDSALGKDRPTRIEYIKDNFNIEPLRKEGISEAKWALLDYGDLIVNIFQPEYRKYYDLESFWSNGDDFKYP